MIQNQALIGVVGKIFELTTNADDFSTRWMIPSTKVLMKISFVRANEKKPYNALRFETKDINLEYHFVFKSKEKYETFLFTTLGHILDIYSNQVLRKENEEVKPSNN